MTEFYVLDGHSVVPVKTVEEWGRRFEDKDRHVGNNIIGDVRISTVFLGINHRFGGRGPPLVFETMIFGAPLDGTQFRYSNWDDAAAGHAAQVTRVKRNGS